mmetsp:Transcript_9618/g.14487  ORF Transcript_9618/g.14487 Transcript_9618/m.14487 type:complete len:287 (-) Transcript_9618:41-901(-)
MQGDSWYTWCTNIFTSCLPQANTDQNELLLEQHPDSTASLFSSSDPQNEPKLVIDDGAWNEDWGSSSDSDQSESTTIPDPVSSNTSQRVVFQKPQLQQPPPQQFLSNANDDLLLGQQPDDDQNNLPHNQASSSTETNTQSTSHLPQHQLSSTERNNLPHHQPTNNNQSTQTNNNQDNNSQEEIDLFADMEPTYKAPATLVLTSEQEETSDHQPPQNNTFLQFDPDDTLDFDENADITLSDDAGAKSGGGWVSDDIDFQAMKKAQEAVEQNSKKQSLGATKLSIDDF